MEKSEIPKFIKKVFEEYPQVKCALNFSSPLQLLVASRLSAQCTDVRVNIVCEELFKKYKTAKDFANADKEELVKAIFSCGLYHSKARDIIAAAKQLEESGHFPETIEEFCSLAGVGRKIANLMMGEIYGDQSVVIADTHCIRLSNRLGLCDSTNPVIVEKTLKKILPPNTGFHYSHAMVAHGRKICKAQNPGCENCFIKEYCEYFKDKDKNKNKDKDKNKGKEKCGIKKSSSK